MDFYIVPTAELKVLFVLDILGHTGAGCCISM